VYELPLTSIHELVFTIKFCKATASLLISTSI